MKTKSILLTLALCLSTSSAFAGNKFSVVTENTIDVGNLFTHPDLQKVRREDSGVPNSIAHIYTLRATYTIESRESTAVISKIQAGCDGMDGAVSCWEDHWEGRLELDSPGNTALWELIDQNTGKTLITRSAKLKLEPAFLVTKDLSGQINFTGAQYMNSPSLSIGDSEREYFLGQEKKYSLYFSHMFLDDLFRMGRVVLEPRGDNRYTLVGIQYGGQTNTGNQIPVVPGAEFPNAGVWLTIFGDHQHPYLVGEPNASRPFGNIRVVKVEN